MKTTFLALTLATTAAFGTTPRLAQAGSDPFIGEIMLFAGHYCPKGWYQANGTLMPVASNPELFSIFGNAYGGDGRSNFALPDLQGRVPVGSGVGKGLVPVGLAQYWGQSQTTLSASQMPSHTHPATSTAVSHLNATTSGRNTGSPNDARLATFSPGNAYSNVGDLDNQFLSGSVTTEVTTTINPNSGGSQPLQLTQPSLGMMYCIAVEGKYPTRN